MLLLRSVYLFFKEGMRVFFFFFFSCILSQAVLVSRAGCCDKLACCTFCNCYQLYRRLAQIFTSLVICHNLSLVSPLSFHLSQSSLTAQSTVMKKKWKKQLCTAYHMQTSADQTVKWMRSVHWNVIEMCLAIFSTVNRECCFKTCTLLEGEHCEVHWGSVCFSRSMFAYL